MRTIKTTTGASITLDGDLLAILETLYLEITVKRNFDRSFEDMMQEINHLIDQMTRGRAACVPGRKPVPERGEIRKRPGGRLHAEDLSKSMTSKSQSPELAESCNVSLNYLATRFPLHLAVEHAGHALRRPHGVRLRRSLRPSRARRRARPERLRHLDRHHDLVAARGPERRRFDDSAATARSSCRSRASRADRSIGRTSGRLPSRMYIECTAACNISCTRGLLRAGNRHHENTQAGMLDFDLFTRRGGRSRAVAGPHRLLQLRRSVPAQARDRDVRVHQEHASRTSISTPARTG